MPDVIPVAAARRIAETYGYDQVVIVALKNPAADDYREHVTTYGVEQEDKISAAEFGDMLRYDILEWDKELTTMHEDFRENNGNS